MKTARCAPSSGNRPGLTLIEVNDVSGYDKPGSDSVFQSAPISPPAGLLMSFLNGLHPKSNS